MKSSEGFVVIDLVAIVAVMAVSSIGNVVTDTVSHLNFSSGSETPTYESQEPTAEPLTPPQNNNEAVIANIDLTGSKTLLREQATICHVTTNQCVTVGSNL